MSRNLRVTVKVVDNDTDTSITRVTVIHPKEGTDKVEAIEEALGDTTDNITLELDRQYRNR